MTRRERRRYARFGIPLAGLGDSRTDAGYVNMVMPSAAPAAVSPLANPFANLVPIPGLTNPGINPGAGYGGAAAVQPAPAAPAPVAPGAPTVSMSSLLSDKSVVIGAAVLGLLIVWRLRQ